MPSVGTEGRNAGGRNELAVSLLVPGTRIPSKMDMAPLNMVIPISDSQSPVQKTTVAHIHNLYITAGTHNGVSLIDGALRIFIVLAVEALGFSSISIAFMFLSYEAAGIVTNLYGGANGSRYGLRKLLLSALVIQTCTIIVLSLVTFIWGDLEDATGSARIYTTVYIAFFETFVGVSKDLMKVAGKSAPKLVTEDSQQGRLWALVAYLGGLKDICKGGGYFLGAMLSDYMGYSSGLWLLAGLCVSILPPGLIWLDRDLGKSASQQIDWRSVYKKTRNINVLSLARFWLFGARNVWFEVALPLFCKAQLGWSSTAVGCIMAGYIILYGLCEAGVTRLFDDSKGGSLGLPTVRAVPRCLALGATVPLLMGLAMYKTYISDENMATTTVVAALGLAGFAATFALNSSIQTFLMTLYCDRDKVIMDQGFYYMAHAAGRTMGTVLSGVLYYYTVDDWGITMCLYVSAGFLLVSGYVGTFLDAAADEQYRTKSKAVTVHDEYVPV